MNFILILKVFLILGFILVGFKDYKDREIPNLASFVLVTLSFFLFTFRLLIKGNSNNINQTVGIIVGLTVLAKMKILGGGDFKVMIAGCLSFPVISFYSIVSVLILTSVLISISKTRPAFLFYFSFIFLLFFILFYFFMVPFLPIIPFPIPHHSTLHRRKEGDFSALKLS